MKPILQPSVFWDIDFEKLDYTQKSTFIIKRVFDKGSFNDLLETIAFYGEPKVIEALTSTHFLTTDTLNFASALFGIPKTSFKCYTSKPSMKVAENF